jgi:uncharacterized LabA/DUF88 family protein
MRAALFVDFDNIYLSFAELDERAAQRFATQPARWLAWFESGAHAFDGMESAAAPRRILVRRCYLNPVTFGRFRSDYTRAAFTAVDCPPLTQRGKTSADVYMVMDVLDALEHATRFDEFIILSSDADFTPVLLRLRAHDRRTTIIATNVAAAAYRAACDNIVPYERFFEEALAIEAEPSLQPEPEPTGDFEVLLPRVARMLREQVLTAGPLAARDVPIAFSAIPEFRNSSWFGCFSLRALMSRLLALEPALKLEGDPNAAWTVVLRDGAEGTQLPTADLARRAVQEVKGLVARAAHPVPMATAAQQVAQLLGPGLRESHWAGYGTFKALLTAHPQPDLMLVESRGGFLLDPARHDRGAADELPEELAAFARRVSTITGTPPLSPAEYAGLFAALAALSTCEPAEPNELSRAVRDRLHAEGLPVSRAQINFVLNGFRYTGFEIPGRSACDLARAWRENMLSLLDSAQVELSGVEYQLLARWLLGMPAGTLEPVPEDCPSDTDEVMAG